jgi:hypothetical protein
MMSNLKMQQQYKPDALEAWYPRINYEGDNFDGYYVAAMRLFRCSPVERSNYAYIKGQILGCFDDPRAAQEDNLLVIATFTDEVYMLRYYVLIHESCEKALRMADMLVKRARKKGSLDPEGEHDMNISSVKSSWRQSEMHAKIRLCAEAGVSIFVARRANFPDGEIGEKLFELLSESSEVIVDGE